MNIMTRETAVMNSLFLYPMTQTQKSLSWLWMNWYSKALYRNWKSEISFTANPNWATRPIFSKIHIDLPYMTLLGTFWGGNLLGTGTKTRTDKREISTNSSKILPYMNHIH